MSKTSARQRHEAFSEWLTWFNKETGRTKKKVKKEAAPSKDASHRVDIKGFRKRK